MAAKPPAHTTAGSRVLLLLACLSLVAGAVLPAAFAATSTTATNGAGTTSTATPDASSEDESSDADELPDVDASARAGRAELPAAPTVSVALANGTVSWAYLDRTTGTRYASDNAAETSYTESMVKAWLAADDLSRSAAAGIEPDYDLLIPMIIDSDDYAAETVWLNNGADASIYRMITTCGLVDTQVYSGWWSMTMMSARDAVSLGQCIADGTAAGAGTPWLLDEMRQVRGEGRFGIIEALTDPAAVAIKNGWTLHYDDGLWRVNCLAIGPDWIISVMSTYPGTDYDLSIGATACAQVTTALTPYLSL